MTHFTPKGRKGLGPACILWLGGMEKKREETYKSVNHIYDINRANDNIIQDSIAQKNLKQSMRRH